MKIRSALAAFVAIFVAYATPARAGASLGVECLLVEEDSIEVDGMLDDWEGIEPQSAGSVDAGVKIRCAQTGEHLYLAIHVQDESVIRTSKQANGKKQDNLALQIGAGRAWSKLRISPGTRGFEPATSWHGKKVAAPVQVADSAQSDGWSVELGLPLDKLAAWGAGTPRLVYKLQYVDLDGGSERESFNLKGTLRFAGATEVYKGFMSQAKLERKDVRLDKIADMDGQRGVERVIWGGRVVGVLSDEYRYLSLPVQSTSDVLKVRVVDLDGEGRSSIMTEHREHGNGGSRDVLAVWNMQSNGSFARTLAVEVRKQLGDNVLLNDWKLEPRKGKRGKTVPGYVLVVTAGDVTGWDEDSYDDVPPTDMRAILTPWAEQTSATYRFEGDQAVGGELPGQ